MLLNILKAVGVIISEGPEIVKLALPILAAFQSLSSDHQAAVSSAVKTHLDTNSSGS